MTNRGIGVHGARHAQSPAVPSPGAGVSRRSRASWPWVGLPPPTCFDVGLSHTCAADGAILVASDSVIASLTVTAVRLDTAATVAVPVGLVVAATGHSHLPRVDAGHPLAAVATGVFGAALPFLLFNAAIRHVSVAGSALTVNLVPLVASALAVAAG